MTRQLMIALVGAAMAVFSVSGVAQTADYSGLTLTQMIAEGDEMVAEMSNGVDLVEEYRADAEADGDASSYQRLNNLYTQMNGRLLVAEEALANLKAAQGSGMKDAVDRATLEHWFSMIVAANSSVMEALRQAQAIATGDGSTAGDGTQVTGNQPNIPEGDVTFTGNVLHPWIVAWIESNTEFVGGSPSTATP